MWRWVTNTCMMGRNTRIQSLRGFDGWLQKHINGSPSDTSFISVHTRRRVVCPVVLMNVGVCLWNCLGAFTRPSGALVCTGPTLGSESVSSTWGSSRTPRAPWTETPSTGVSPVRSPFTLSPAAVKVRCWPSCWFFFLSLDVLGASQGSSLWSSKLCRDALSFRISPPSLKKPRNCFHDVASCRLYRRVLPSSSSRRHRVHV